jgi:hypothetical protein
MHFPRFAGDRCLVCLAALLLVPAGPLIAHTRQEGTKASSNEHLAPTARPQPSDRPALIAGRRSGIEQDQKADETRPDAGLAGAPSFRLRGAYLLARLMKLNSPYSYPPPNSPPPMANSPPGGLPPSGTPTPSGGPPGGPNTSPEPASVITGLLGSALAGLFAYARKRRLRRRMRLEVSEETSDGVELAMAA